jgi:hypothetical protein
VIFLRPIIIILLVLLVLAAAVAFVLVSSPQEDVIDDSSFENLPDDINTINPNGGAGDENQPHVPEEVVDPNTYCEDFACFSNNFSTCQENIVFTSTESIDYPSAGSRYNYSVEYSIEGLNESNECVVSLKLLDHNTSFLDAKKQMYLDDSYTEEGIAEMEVGLNESSKHLISKEGSCNLDASNPEFLNGSLDFMKNLMLSYEKCSGELFLQQEGLKSFFIYID